MKVSAPELTHAVPVAGRNWAAIYADLFKFRLTMLVLLTTMAGFYIGFTGNLDSALLWHTVVGTALLASGGAALNQLIERDFDACMRRTQDRPLPAGRLHPRTVLWIGSVLSALGLGYLLVSAGVPTAIVGAITLFIYIFVYTPLKRVSWLNTIVGAIPGALPPLIGWTAAKGTVTLEGLSIFAIQGLWQIPHFMAIAWLYRDEYARAGFKMLPVIDASGHRTGRQTVFFAALLLPASFLPYWFGLSGKFYLATALVLTLLFTWSCFRFARQLTLARGREAFLISILYLPLLMGAMVLDKLPH